MRTNIVVLGTLLTLASTTCSASEVFVSQIAGARHLASNFKSSFGQAGSAAKIASPIKLEATTPVIRGQLPPGANVSSITQVGTNNVATVAQIGGNNLSAIVQQGSGNQAIVSQRR